MRRRDFLTILSSAAATASPWVAHAQQGERVRRIGVLWGGAEDAREGNMRRTAFRKALEKLGWSASRNVHIDYRFAAASVASAQLLATELVALQPEVILAHSTPMASALQHATGTIPIMFFDVSDPIGSGFIVSLARPGRNLTGLLLFETTIAGKWLAMLKEMAPYLARVALIANPKTTPFEHFMRGARDVAPSLSVELVAARAETAAEIERAIESIALLPNGGLILPPDTTTGLHRDLILARAASHRLPAIYGSRQHVEAGGLISYGTDRMDMLRQAAIYVDRILRGANPADLPVQAPTKYETVINLKTAKALGLSVPPTLLVAADEVIE